MYKAMVYNVYIQWDDKRCSCRLCYWVHCVLLQSSATHIFSRKIWNVVRACVCVASNERILAQVAFSPHNARAASGVKRGAKAPDELKHTRNLRHFRESSSTRADISKTVLTELYHFVLQSRSLFIHSRLHVHKDMSTEQLTIPLTQMLCFR